MFGLGAPELIVIAIVILALFGYKKLPDAARSVGRSMRIFKAETRGLREDSVAAKAEAEARRGPLGSAEVPPTTQAHQTTPPGQPYQQPEQPRVPQSDER
ncbi:MAG TPA: Sec-independent protein translocase subunit TatA [Mycobacteriales bacterium]|nr:Sec-independent protein translocase subunit TatA [Mycobacteriales bacterium]